MNRKVLIIGGPKTGKTTHARSYGLPVMNTDHLANTMAWGEDSAEVAKWLEKDESCVIEGTAVVRGLRKWMALHPNQSLDGIEVVNLTRAHQPQSDGQARMDKGVQTIWGQIRADVVRRGGKA